MDSIIETLIYYLNDWQQAAIDNTRYSVILIAISVFFASLAVWFWNRKSINALKQQLVQQQQTVQQLTEINDKLLAEQKLSAENTTVLEQQVEQLTEQKTLEKEQHQSELLQKEEQHSLSLLNKQNEFEQLEATLKVKNQIIEELQNTVSQQQENQAKLVELEKEYALLSNELNTIKQQLVQTETELKEKNTLLEYQHKNESTDHDNLAKIAELESALTASQSEITSNSQKQQVSNTKPIADLENTIKKHNQLLQQYNQKLSTLLPQLPAAKQKTNTVTAEESNKASKSFIDKVKNVVSTLDNVDVSDKKFDNTTVEDAITTTESNTTDQDIWEIHQQLIDQLIEQTKNQQPSVQTKPVVSATQPSQERSAVSVTPKVQQKSADRSEKNAQSKEKEESLQNKLMDFYHKIRSS